MGQAVYKKRQIPATDISDLSQIRRNAGTLHILDRKVFWPGVSAVGSMICGWLVDGRWCSGTAVKEHCIADSTERGIAGTLYLRLNINKQKFIVMFQPHILFGSSIFGSILRTVSISRMPPVFVFMAHCLLLDLLAVEHNISAFENPYG